MTDVFEDSTVEFKAMSYTRVLPDDEIEKIRARLRADVSIYAIYKGRNSTVLVLAYKKPVEVVR